MDFADVVERVGALKSAAEGDDRDRIRAILDGGASGVQAVLTGGMGVPYQGAGSGKGPSSFGVDLPTANIMHSQLERMAQKIGREPTLKTDMIPTKDTDLARKAAEKRGRIVQGWDDVTDFDMQFGQIGRWLPGYGFTVQMIRERKFGDTTYPDAELRDPYTCYPGAYGTTQQPTELAIVRMTSRYHLAKSYPEWHDKIMSKSYKMAQGGAILGQGGWEGNPHDPIELWEYACGDGTYIACPELESLVGYIPNPLDSGPAFVIQKRFSFNQLQSHFAHVIGLMTMMAKLNILGLIGVEDSTFRETNVIGELVGKTYKRGRFAVNKFEQGTRIEKPTSDQLQQTWQAINILERQFRIVSGYPVAEDGQSPNSFATGQGIRELGESANENIREYQKVIRKGTELVDQKRLEWEYVMHPKQRKKVYYFEGSKHKLEEYVPDKDIAGDFRTKRVYGAMATFDENSKIVAGLQLMQARVIDRRTFQEQLDGLENVSLINERIDGDMAKEMLITALGQRSGERDPMADQALLAIMKDPKDVDNVLEELLAPPEIDPAAMGGMPGMDPAMAGMGGGEAIPPGGPPPGVQTVLSQMETPGGGAMTVGRT